MIEKSVPLVIDLDGTLIKNDTVIESIIKSINSNILNIIKIFLFYFNKKKLKIFLEKFSLSISEIKFNNNIIQLIDSNYKKKKMILCTGASSTQSKIIYDHLDKFDSYFSSTKDLNLVGKNKMNFLLDIYGNNNFDYVGNSFTDIYIWRKSRKIYYAGTSILLLTLLKFLFNKEKIIVVSNLKSKKFFFYNFLKLVRLRSWSKNLLIFFPIFLSNQINLINIQKCLVGFFIFSLVCSITYIINDLLDLHSDRKKELTKHRPFASFALDISFCKFILPLLLFSIATLILIFNISYNTLYILLLYFVLTIFYSLILKKIYLIDIFILSVFFSLRIYFGSNLSDIILSVNLVFFSIPFFIFLAAIKRIIEINNFNHSNKNQVNKLYGRPYTTKDKILLTYLSLISFLLSQYFIFRFMFSDSIFLFYNYQIIPYLLILTFLFWSIRIFILAIQNKINTDPVTFATKDKLSIISGIIMFLLFIINFI